MAKKIPPASDGPTSIESDIAYWEQQSTRLERDARRLRMVPILCWLTAVGVLVARAPLGIALSLVVLGFAILAMSGYMIFVRRQECAQGLQDARLKQRQATSPQMRIRS